MYTIEVYQAHMIHIFSRCKSKLALWYCLLTQRLNKKETSNFRDEYVWGMYTGP